MVSDNRVFLYWLTFDLMPVAVGNKDTPRTDEVTPDPYALANHDASVLCDARTALAFSPADVQNSTTAHINSATGAKTEVAIDDHRGPFAESDPDRRARTLKAFKRKLLSNDEPRTFFDRDSDGKKSMSNNNPSAINFGEALREHPSTEFLDQSLDHTSSAAATHFTDNIADLLIRKMWPNR